MMYSGKRQKKGGIMGLHTYEKKHLEKLRGCLAECCVLIKKNGAFPINVPGKIAAYGSGVRNTIKGGTGSGEVNSRYFTTIETGLAEAGFTITTENWLDEYDKVRAEAKKDFLKEIKKRAKANHTAAAIEGMGAVMPEPEYEIALVGDGDAAIYVVSRISGEGNDRKPELGDVFLTASEQRDILALNKKYERFMLVLNVGGPIDLTPVREVGNILVLSQLGVETGAALADIILGKTYPSGKLTTTWSAWEDYCKIGEFGEKDDTRYTEGVYVGYRYFDSIGKKAMFPFGYGLGYTDFEINDVKVSVQGEQVSVKAKIKNVGMMAGKEVVQVYVSSPWGELDKPYQALAGFAKSKEVKAGEEAEVAVSFKLSALASFDSKQAAYILEKGNYIVRVGTSSADTTVCAVLNLKETVITGQLKNTCGEPDFTDWKPQKLKEESIEENVLVISINTDAFTTEEVSYELQHEIADKVKEFTDEQLAYINVGAYSKGGILSIIGNAAQQVAGAAGETTSIMKEEGFPALVMADGPAGVRISPKYYKDEKGVHGLEPALPASIAEYLPKPAAWFLNRKPNIKKGVEIKEQYATAIPIGTAVAQSWNLEFAKMCGDIIGTEMELFGVHLWLAPALNIHRSILCGRNFEYYSEDPLISGLFAAAMTNGVQAHPGCGATIKHYAANNQETCRYSNNSVVSERAMREIYLKGFEICVKESQPLALMTSYNLLNGVHTSERRDLTEDILRCEWRFKGIVMTDWVIAMFTQGDTKYAGPHAGKVASAGGDLFMPGAEVNCKEILEALRDGILSRKQLEINATRVYNTVKQLVK